MNNVLPRIDPEFKALIPPLSPEEYAQLEQNILSAKTCRDAIITWNGTIVDGHNRFAICAQHGISFEHEEINFDTRDEAMLWILDNQLGRRNLSDAMKIELAFCKTEMLREQAKENLKRGGPRESRAEKPFPLMPKPINIHKTVADEAGVSKDTVHKYTQLSKHADPELIKKVQSGEVKIGTAHRLIDPQIKKELKRVDVMYRKINKHLHLVQGEAERQELDARLADLQGHLAVLMGGVDKNAH